MVSVYDRVTAQLGTPTRQAARRSSTRIREGRRSCRGNLSAGRWVRSRWARTGATSSEDILTLAIGIAALLGARPAGAGPAILNAPDGRHGQASANVEGWEFVPTANITVTALGTFDGDNDGGLGGTPDGLAVAAPVGIYDLSCQLIASATVPAGTGGALLGEFRYAAIAPVVLNAGQSYRIASVATAPDSSANTNSGSFGVDPAITYVVNQRQPFTSNLVCPSSNGGLDIFGPNFIIGSLGAFCGNGAIEVAFGEQCDDGNTNNGDCCDSSCHYEATGSPCPADGDACTDDVCDGNGGCGTFNTAPCDDLDFCTENDACDGTGTCAGGPPPNCNDGNRCSQDSCNSSSGCVNDFAPAASCRAAAKSLLLLKNNATDDRKDKLVWKWLKGAETTMEDLGLPTGTTNYTLCLYAGPDSAAVALAAGSSWQAAGMTGFKFKSGTPDSAQKALLKSGSAGKAKALIKGKGVDLPDTLAPALPLPVTAQLVNDTNGVCFGTVYYGATKNDSRQFKAKTL